LAVVYREQGKYAEAEAGYQRALAIQEAKLGNGHPVVAQTLNNLASVYQAQGKYAEAERHFKRTLAIFESKLGGDHLRVAQTLNNLAVLYERQRKAPPPLRTCLAWCKHGPTLRGRRRSLHGPSQTVP